MSCDYRIVFTFSVAEYARPLMRKAALDFGFDLGLSSRRSYRRLLNMLRDAKAHFTDATGRVFDLDLSAFEPEEDAYEVDARANLEALRDWLRQTYSRRWPLDALPEFTDVGKARFMTTTSILVAAYPALEEELIRLANEEVPSPKD